MKPFGSPGFSRLLALLLPLCFVLGTGAGCLPLGFIFPEDESDAERNRLMMYIALYYLLNQESSNSCDSISSPNVDSAAASGTLGTGYASIRGKFTTSAGAPVVGAVVMLDNNVYNDSIHYGTHSSIDRDGSFIISGVPTGVNYRLAIESLNTDSFSGRIDSHLNCYNSPSTFTSGWYNGSGDTITTTEPTAAITLTDSQTLDVGTIKLLE